MLPDLEQGFFELLVIARMHCREARVDPLLRVAQQIAPARGGLGGLRSEELAGGELAEQPAE